MKKPKNSNYSALVVKIQTTYPLEGCDFVQAASILGNQVIVDKSVKEGDMGLFFPVECKLSKEYLSNNNLYRKPELNLNPEKKGYFEENGRIRCVKFRGHKSEGLFMPMNSIDFTKHKESLVVGDSFDELNGIGICEKYVVVQSGGYMTTNATKNSKIKESKIIEGQFRFHEDTEQLYRNIHKIQPNDLISITYKVHGTSGISSYVLCKKSLKWYEKVLKKLGVNVVDTYYDYIYSSRKVIKNPELNPNANHFYDVDIWGLAHKKLEPFLTPGLTLYYEIAGYLPNGGYIQKGYDYGCDEKEFKIFVYRITYTSPIGNVFEFSAKQVQEWCKSKGLLPVFERYYGEAIDFVDYNLHNEDKSMEFSFDLLNAIKLKYTEHDCFMCSGNVPAEGCVVRIDNKLEFEAYKVKSARFYEMETALLDKGVSDIESEN